MWHPPLALPPDEQKRVARTRQARKFFVLLRERRHALLDADGQTTLAPRESAEPGGNALGEAGMLALAPLLPAACQVGARDAVELTVLDKRWPMVLACLGAEPPPCSPGPLFHLRRRRIALNLDQTRLERPGAWAEKTGGCGARQRRAGWDATPLGGAGRVEATWTRRGHARRQAVGLAAQALGTSAAAVVADAGLTLVGHRSRTAALALAGGEPRARARALGLVREEGARWQPWRAPPPPLAAEPPPLPEGLETSPPMLTQDPEPAPGGGPSGRRRQPHVAPDRRIAREEKDRRPGRQRRATTCNGFPEPLAVDWARPGIREVVGRPANAPEPEAVALRAEELEQAPGLLQLEIALGDRASPRRAPGEAQGGDILARPWPPGGPLGTHKAGTVDWARLQGTGPGGQSVPMGPGQPAQFPAAGV